MIAGPGAEVEVDTAVLAGALEIIINGQHIAAGLAAAGHRDRRPEMAASWARGR